MKRRAKLTLAVACAALAACASLPPKKPAGPVVSLRGDAVIFDGDLRPDSLEKIRAILGQRKVAKLIMRSGGGEVTGAMKLARWVRENDIDVEVDGECFSSCANYVFPAGRNKYIVGQGIVAWHGTIAHIIYKHEQGFSKMDDESLPSLQAIADTERAFYAEMGINAFTGWFGKVAPYNVYNMYYLSKDDMEYLGMRNLHVRADYPQADLRKYNKYNPKTIQLLAVNRALTNPSDERWHASRTPPAAP